MGELLPLLSYPPFADLLRSSTSDGVYASLQRTTSPRILGPFVSDALEQALFWFHEWLELEGDKLMQAAVDAALDDFV